MSSDWQRFYYDVEQTASMNDNNNSNVVIPLKNGTTWLSVASDDVPLTPANGGISEVSLRRRKVSTVTGGLVSDVDDFKDEVAAMDETQTPFFAKGRDFESIYTNHRYTDRERDILASHESFDYLPSHSAVYKQWLTRQPSRLDWDRWVMMGIIGISVGLVGFLLHQFIHLIADIKWHRAEHYFQDHNMLSAWLWVVGYGVVFVIAGAASVAFVCLPAGGSGIPEVIGFLNGTVMRHVLNFPAFCVKFFSCSCAVGAGLPVGPEGPMIHIGSIVGNGVSQCESRTFGIKLPIFTRFRNSEDRRNFTTAGAAAGVAAAFVAPVGGLLFGMEEVSSFWSLKLGWMIFFCCMVATFTADLFNSSIESFAIHDIFGLFQTDKFMVFKISSIIPVNLIMFLPAVLLGVIGGVSGSMFTVGNLKIARLRRRLLAKIKSPLRQKIARIVEPVLIMIIYATIVVFLPGTFPCEPMVCPQGVNNTSLVDRSYNAHNTAASGGGHHAARQSAAELATGHHTVRRDVHGGGHHAEQPSPHGNHDGHPHYTSTCPDNTTVYSIDSNVRQYWCKRPTFVDGIVVDGEYNEVASLINVPGPGALRLLYSRQTHYQFGYGSLLTVLPIYFILSCWAAGSAVSSGIVVPMLFIGALYGRAVGRLLVDLHGHIPTDRFWQWIDPGALALIGSASFFGGVSRLTMSLTVIMVEITNDLAFLLPIMVAIMVSKWVGDYITHSLYHSLLEFKCIPYLEEEPIVHNEKHELLNLEMFKARDVMHSPVITVTSRESVAHLARLLLETTHGGFPVVRKFNGVEVAYGLVNRSELCVILCHEKTRNQDMSKPDIVILPNILYEELSADTLPSKPSPMEILEKYVNQSIYSSIYIDLEPYVNHSAPRIEDNFSLHRTYIVFRTLGLRHLTVVDPINRVVGIITRKDLMGFSVDEKLEQRKRRGYSIVGGALKDLPSEQDSSPQLQQQQQHQQQRQQHRRRSISPDEASLLAVSSGTTTSAVHDDDVPDA